MGQVPFSSYHSKVMCHQHGSWQLMESFIDHLSEVVSVRFLHDKVTPFSHLLTIFCGRRSPEAIYTSGREVMFHLRKVGLSAQVIWNSAARKISLLFLICVFTHLFISWIFILHFGLQSMLFYFVVQSFWALTIGSSFSWFLNLTDTLPHSPFHLIIPIVCVCVWTVPYFLAYGTLQAPLVYSLPQSQNQPSLQGLQFL